MDTGRFITEGMLVEMDGAQYECTRDLGVRFEFSELNTGATKKLELLELLTEFAKQSIRLVPAKVTPNAIDIHDDTDSQQSVVTLSEKNQRILDIRLAYIFGIRKRGITRGQRALLHEAAREIADEINKLRKIGDAPVKPPSVATLNRWMSHFDKSLKNVMAVLPKSVFRKKTEIINKKNEELIEEALDTKLFDGGCANLRNL